MEIGSFGVQNYISQFLKTPSNRANFNVLYIVFK